MRKLYPDFPDGKKANYWKLEKKKWQKALHKKEI